MEVLSTLSIGDGSVTPQKIYLAVDSNKICYVVQPSGAVLTSTAGVIDTTWGGSAGFISFISPKNSSSITISLSDVSGNLRTDFIGDLFVSSTYITGLWARKSRKVISELCPDLTNLYSDEAIEVLVSNCANLESVLCPKVNIFYGTGCSNLNNINAPIGDYISIPNCIKLSNLSANKVSFIYAHNCALTDKSVGDILYNAYEDDRLAVNFDFSGGTSALQGAVNTYLQATYAGLTLTTVMARLVTTNLGTVTIDAV